MSNVKNDEWGPTAMARYAIQELGVIGMSEDSLRHGIASKLRSLGITGKGGRAIFSEKRAKEILEVDLTDYLAEKRTMKSPDEQKLEWDARNEIGKLNENYSDYQEALAKISENYKLGLLANIDEQELFFAEMRLVFDYLLKKDGLAFDRKHFEEDYRDKRQVEHNLSILEERIMSEDEEKRAMAEFVRLKKLEHRLQNSEAYIVSDCTPNG